jgi:hypothetical protein
MADRSEVLDAGLFEVGQVATVVHDAHGVGLGETHSDGVSEDVITRFEGGLAGAAHPEDGSG